MYVPFVPPPPAALSVAHLLPVTGQGSSTDTVQLTSRVYAPQTRSNVFSSTAAS